MTIFILDDSLNIRDFTLYLWLNRLFRHLFAIYRYSLWSDGFYLWLQLNAELRADLKERMVENYQKPGQEHITRAIDKLQQDVRPKYFQILLQIKFCNVETRLVEPTFKACDKLCFEVYGLTISWQWRLLNTISQSVSIMSLCIIASDTTSPWENIPPSQEWTLFLFPRPLPLHLFHGAAEVLRQ